MACRPLPAICDRMRVWDQVAASDAAEDLVDPAAPVVQAVLTWQVAADAAAADLADPVVVDAAVAADPVVLVDAAADVAARGLLAIATATRHLSATARRAIIIASPDRCSILSATQY